MIDWKKVLLSSLFLLATGCGKTMVDLPNRPTEGACVTSCGVRVTRVAKQQGLIGQADQVCSRVDWENGGCAARPEGVVEHPIDAADSLCEEASLAEAKALSSFQDNLGWSAEESCAALLGWKLELVDAEFGKYRQGNSTARGFTAYSTKTMTVARFFNTYEGHVLSVDETTFLAHEYAHVVISSEVNGAEDYRTHPGEDSHSTWHSEGGVEDAIYSSANHY